ncbi:hypothetical protein BB561_004884 [Smittium simulii]|uniref:AMP-dependent synthetase/ligase domain-containing protein n=1 Tax=Smittium simulii TaxID=133385 RepID=A0A2T9YDK9_9FUNG|nr:hypothetical protein BB561_004884 [Smittium simulii]
MYFNNPKSYIVPNSVQEGYTPATENPDGEYIGYRPYDPYKNIYLPYVFQTYRQISNRLHNFGSGLIYICLSLCETQEERASVLGRKWPVAIYASNRPEWNITDRSLSTQSLYSVGLYDSLGEFAMEYIMNHSESSVIVCSLDKIPKILENIQKLPLLKLIISMDSLSGDKESNIIIPPPFNTKSNFLIKKWAESLNVQLYDMESVEIVGELNPIPPQPPKPDDIYTLLYTSGTTGTPKAAVSLHSQYTSAAIGTLLNRASNEKVVLLSYLPLPHAYGRTMENYVTACKGTIGYFSGDITRIIEDCQALNPTYFPGVPRLLSRFYDILSSKTINSSGMFGIVSRMALKEKVYYLYKNNTYNHSIWDKLVFDKTKNLLGNRLERISTGTAPLPASVLDFLRVSLSIPITEGYAMTETSSLGIGQNADSVSNGNVGIPHYGIEVRLRSVPEMNYLVTDMPNARGEICMRGKSIFCGYLKDIKVTNETLIGDGWIASGDIGQINLDGTISIIDRKKSLFKTSQGVYISPDKIESYLIRHKLVLQSFVHGYSSQNHCVAIIVPDPIHFIPWANKHLKKNTSSPLDVNTSMEFLIKNITVKQKFLDEIIMFSKESGLSGIETVKSVYLEHIPFDIETNKLLTPTLKLKRFDAIKYYKSIINMLYTSKKNN